MKSLKKISMTNQIMIAMVLGIAAGLFFGPAIAPIAVIGQIFLPLFHFHFPLDLLAFPFLHSFFSNLLIIFSIIKAVNHVLIYCPTTYGYSFFAAFFLGNVISNLNCDPFISLPSFTYEKSSIPFGIK